MNELRRVWTRDSLRHAGFTGWVPWSQCPEALTAIPLAAGGVYVIFRVNASPPSFRERSAAGRFTGEDPTVALSSLEANWVPDASVVYIGKANHGRLRRRLEEFVGLGRGRPIGHRGGRLIWQLADAEDLLVAWRIMPLDAVPLREPDSGTCFEAHMASLRSRTIHTDSARERLRRGVVGEQQITRI